jgi:hypothetical protein
MLDGHPANYHRINVGTEKEPVYVNFPQCPSTEDIIKACNEAKAKHVQDQQRKKG